MGPAWTQLTQGRGRENSRKRIELGPMGHGHLLRCDCIPEMQTDWATWIIAKVAQRVMSPLSVGLVTRPFPLSLSTIVVCVSFRRFLKVLALPGRCPRTVETVMYAGAYREASRKRPTRANARDSFFLRSPSCPRLGINYIIQGMRRTTMTICIPSPSPVSRASGGSGSNTPTRGAQHFSDPRWTVACHLVLLWRSSCIDTKNQTKLGEQGEMRRRAHTAHIKGFSSFRASYWRRDSLRDSSSAQL